MTKRILALAALLSASTAYAGTPGWTISESSGSVIVSRPGYSAAATRGGAIKAGDIVSTGKNGRAVLVRGEEYLVVSPGARITIADPKPGAMTQIIQSFGNTLYKIKKMATPHFAVETPYLAAVVKGTTFSVTVTPKGASVQVTEGRVEVATPDGGASYLVTPGEIGIVSRDAPYRLKIEGKEARTIESPNRATTPASTDIEVQAVESASALDASIAEGISEAGVQLASLSGGMISGDAAISVATVSSRVAPVARPATGVVIMPPVAVPPVPADTATAIPPVAGIAPTVTGSVIDVAPGATPPAESPPVPSEIAIAIPAVTPPIGALPPVSGAGSSPTPISTLPLAPIPVETVAAIPPVAPSVGAVVPGAATAPGGNATSGSGFVVGNNPTPAGNNGNGQGNGGGNGSNAGGNGNGNGNHFGDDDGDDDRGGGRSRGLDDDDDSRDGRGPPNRGNDD